MAYNVKARRGESRYTKDSSKYGTDVKESAKKDVVTYFRDSSGKLIPSTYTYQKYSGGELKDVKRNILTGREKTQTSLKDVRNYEQLASRLQTSRLRPGQSTILRNAQGQRLRVQRTLAGELLFGRLDRRGEAFMREKAEALARKKKQGRPLLGKDIFQAAGYKKGQPLDVLRELGKLKAAIGKERQVILAQNFAKKYKTSVSKATIASIRKSGLTKSTINKLQKDAAAVQNFINYARNTLGVSYEREPAFLRMSKVAAYVKKQTGKQTPRATSYTIKRWRSRKLKDVLNDPSKLITSQIQISQLYLQERGKRIQSEVSGGKINRKLLFYDMVDKSNLPAWGKALLKKNVDVSNYIVVSFDEMARNTVEVLPIALYNAALKYAKVGELMLRSKDKRQFFRKLGLEHAKGEAAAKEAMKEAIKDPITYAAALAMLPEIYAGISKSGAFTKTTFPSFAKVNASYPRLSLARLGSALRTVGKYAIPRGKLASFNVGVKTFQRQLKRPISKAAKRKGVTRAGQKQGLQQADAKSKSLSARGEQALQKLGLQKQDILSISKDRIPQITKPTDRLSTKELKRLHQTLFGEKAPKTRKADLKRIINRRLRTPTGGFDPFKPVSVQRGLIFKPKKFDYVSISGTGKLSFGKFPKSQAVTQQLANKAYISISEIKIDAGGRAFRYVQKLSQQGSQFLTKKYLKTGREVSVKATKTIRNQLKSAEQARSSFQGIPKGRSGMNQQQVSSQVIRTLTENISQRAKKHKLKIKRLKESRQKRVSFEIKADVSNFFKRNARILKSRTAEAANKKINFEIKAEVTNFMKDLLKATEKIKKPVSKKTQSKVTMQKKASTKKMKFLSKEKAKRIRKTRNQSKTSAKADSKIKESSRIKEEIAEAFISRQQGRVAVKNTFSYAKASLSKLDIMALSRFALAAGVASSFKTKTGQKIPVKNAYKYNLKNDIVYEQIQSYNIEDVTVKLQKTSPVKPVRKPGQRPTSTRTTKVISSPKPPKLPRGKRKTEYFTEKTPRLPLPKPPKLPKMPQGVKNPKGYDVYIKRGKAYKRLNPFSLTGPSAAKFGKWLTNNAVARSFVIVGTLRKGRAAPKYVAKTPSGLFRKPKKNSKLRTTSVVEKRKYAINTRGERKGLSAARVLSAARRKVTKKRTKKKK